MYLFRTLKSLENAYFASDHNIIISTDCDNHNILAEISAIRNLFNTKSYRRLPFARLITQKIDKTCANRITHHYFLAIRQLLHEAYPRATYFIVLEDDLLVSEDFLHYRGARFILPPSLPKIKKAISFLFFEIATCNFDLRTRGNFSFFGSYPAYFFDFRQRKWRLKTF